MKNKAYICKLKDELKRNYSSEFHCEQEIEAQSEKDARIKMSENLVPQNISRRDTTSLARIQSNRAGPEPDDFVCLEVN